MTELDPLRLPPASQALLGQIESSDTLGASRQLVLASRLFTTLADEHHGSAHELLRALAALSERLIRARGASSQAIPNAIRLMLAGLDEQSDGDLDALRNWVRRAVDRYAGLQRAWSEEMTSAATQLLGGAASVAAYDYSGSVADILIYLARRPDPPSVVVFEGRPLDGGAKYIPDLVREQLEIRFLPDAAMLEGLANVDAALVGAETITLEGGCYNTVGTRLLASAARDVQVPFYVASTMIKIDLNTAGGPHRSVPVRDLATNLTGAWEADLAAAVSCLCPDLDYTPPDVITAYISEHGVEHPSAVVNHAAWLEHAMAGSVT